MKLKEKILLMAGLGLGALGALAASPAYLTQSANGTHAAPASLIIPADPYTQIRVLDIDYSTDTNNSALSFTSGTTVYSIMATNVAPSSITNQINSTNGLAAGATLVLQHNGACYSATVATWNCSTNAGPYGAANVVLSSGGWGVSTTPGDGVYLMGNATTMPAPAAVNGTTTTVNLSGEAIYVAQLSGRPVSVSLSPALSANALNAVTVHRD